VFDVSEERVYELMNNLFDEITKLFPDPYIHLGGDEVHTDIEH
jgi:hexosaminidase